MYVDRRFLGWGVFLILAGALPLAVRGGYLGADAAAEAWRLWPLILVGIGAGILLSRTALGWVGGLIIAATFGLLVGAALAAGVDHVGCGFDMGEGTGGGTATTRNGELGDGAVVDLDFDCGTLTLRTASGTQWSLVSRGDADPTVDTSPQRLAIANAGAGPFGRGSSWDVSLPTGRMLAISFDVNAASAQIDLSNAQLSRLDSAVNAGSMELNLSGARVADLDLRVNAGSASLTLPSSSFDGRMSVNLGSIELCAPSDVGLRLTTSGALSSTDFSGSGLILSGSTWESPGFASATARIQLTISANLGSVTMTRGGGCQ